MATLLVLYTMDSSLQKSVQTAEDKCVELMGGQESESLSRGEGSNNAVQCMDCVLKDLGSTYQGETLRSTRQCQGEHVRDLEAGLVSSPLVLHAIQEHRGRKPWFLHVVRRFEPRPLYWAVWESLYIASNPDGPENLNRCLEWGGPMGSHPGGQRWGPGT